MIGSKGHADDLQAIKELRKAGKSQREIAKTLRLSKGTVQRALAATQWDTTLRAALNA
jgi:transposase